MRCCYEYLVFCLLDFGIICLSVYLVAITWFVCLLFILLDVWLCFTAVYFVMVFSCILIVLRLNLWFLGIVCSGWLLWGWYKTRFWVICTFVCLLCLYLLLWVLTVIYVCLSGSVLSFECLRKLLGVVRFVDCL